MDWLRSKIFSSGVWELAALLMLGHRGRRSPHGVATVLLVSSSIVALKGYGSGSGRPDATLVGLDEQS